MTLTTEEQNVNSTGRQSGARIIIGLRLLTLLIVMMLEMKIEFPAMRSQRSLPKCPVCIQESVHQLQQIRPRAGVATQAG
jgi:hypothetical protein